MLKHCVSTALVLAQLAFAGPLGQQPRDGITNCQSVSTVTTTVFSQVTVTIGEPSAFVTTNGDADATSPCHATGAGNPSSGATSLKAVSSAVSSAMSTKASGTGNQETVDVPLPLTSTSSNPQDPVSATTAPIATHVPAAKRHLSNMLYFGAWTIYGQKFMPENLPSDQVTHLLYAFGDIAENGSVIPTDEWADVQTRFPGDSEEKSGQNVYGNVKHLYLHKLKNRKLKTIFSIGGWSFSQEGKFHGAAQTPEGRERFATTAVKLMADWGFDGLDIDWEYPENKQEGDLLTLLLQACRKAMDDYAAEHGQKYHYLLSIAASASPLKYKYLNLPALDEVLDTWHLMAYDYSGSWDQTTGHAANLYASPGNPEMTKANTHQAVQDYISGGVRSEKLVLGIPLYGRSFLSTGSQLGLPFQGYATNTSTDDGVWLYRDLPRAGSSTTVQVDRDSVGAWTYDPDTKELVAFDNVETANIKADYILDHRLGGAMFWEAAGDKTGDESLVGSVAKKFGHEQTTADVSDNMLDYPGSPYANIRNKMTPQ